MKMYKDFNNSIVFHEELALMITEMCLDNKTAELKDIKALRREIKYMIRIRKRLFSEKEPVKP